MIIQNICFSKNDFMVISPAPSIGNNKKTIIQSILLWSSENILEFEGERINLRENIRGENLLLKRFRPSKIYRRSGIFCQLIQKSATRCQGVAVFVVKHGV